MSNQSFDNEVRQKMSDHESPVPPGTWEAINRKKKRKRYLLLWWVPLAGLIALGVNNALELNSSDTGFKNSTVQKENSRGSSKNATEMNSKEGSIPSKADSEAVSKSSVNANKESKQINDSADINEVMHDLNVEGARSNKGGGANQIQLLEDKKPGVTEKNSVQVELSITSAGKITKSKNKLTIKEDTRDLENKAGITSPILSEKGNATSLHIKKNNALTPSSDYTYVNSDPYSVLSIRNAGELSRVRNKSIEVGNIYPPKIAPSPDTIALKAIQRNLTNFSISPKSKWSIEIGLNAFIPVRKTQQVHSIKRTIMEPLHEAEFTADKIDINLQPSMAYFIGLRKKLNRKLAIGIGLQYGVIKETVFLSGSETNKHSQVIQRLENGSGGPVLTNDTVVVTTTGTRTIDAINSYRFLDIPLSLHYNFSNSRNLSISLTAGVNLGIYSSYNNSIRGKLVPISTNAPHKSQTLFRTEFLAGVRISRPFFRRTEIFAEPYLRFNPAGYENTVINQRSVHQAGVGLGLSFKL